MADITVGLTDVRPTAEAPPSSSNLTVCGKGPSQLRDGQTVPFQCMVRGRYVAIVRENVDDYLTLCEVGVYGVANIL